MNFFNKISGHSAALDTRIMNPGDVFFAIGNGHNFVQNALQQKAKCAVISDNKYACDKTILVNDTVKTMLDYGLFCKYKAKAKIVAITGSVGKTSTKMWLAEILAKKYHVMPGIGNYNTIYGIPICLSMLRPVHDYGIYEMGTNKCGEMSAISNYLKPHVLVITNITDAHIGNFGSYQTLLDEKLSALSGLPGDGVLVINGDEPYSKNITHKNIITFGEKKHNDVVISDFAKYFNSELKSCEYYNCAAIIAVMIALGINYKDFLQYFASLNPLRGRGNIIKCKYNENNFTLIDDAYNACPTSMKAALHNLATFHGTKIAIIGEMLELGHMSYYYHEQIAKLLVSLKIDKVYFVGSEPLCELFREFGFKTFNNITKDILDDICEGDIVLIKGSHSTNLWRLVDFITTQ